MIVDPQSFMIGFLFGIGMPLAFWLFVWSCMNLFSK
jgi:hypothetical protein